MTIALALTLALVSSAEPPDVAAAVDLYESGQYQKARERLEAVITNATIADPDKARARVYLAATYLSQKQEAPALFVLQDLVRRSPEYEPDRSVFPPALMKLFDQARALEKRPEPDVKPDVKHTEATKPPEKVEPVTQLVVAEVAAPASKPIGPAVWAPAVTGGALLVGSGVLFAMAHAREASLRDGSFAGDVDGGITQGHNYEIASAVMLAGSAVALGIAGYSLFGGSEAQASAAIVPGGAMISVKVPLP